MEADADSLTEESRLIEDLEADSVDFLDLVLILHDEFRVPIDLEDPLDLFARLGRFTLGKLSLKADTLSESDLVAMTSALTIGTLADFILAEVVPNDSRQPPFPR
jgi:hypothetical protein